MAVGGNRVPECLALSCSMGQDLLLALGGIASYSDQAVPHSPWVSSSAFLHCTYIILLLFLSPLHYLLAHLSGTRVLWVPGIISSTMLCTCCVVVVMVSLDMLWPPRLCANGWGLWQAWFAYLGPVGPGRGSFLAPCVYSYASLFCCLYFFSG